MIRCVTFDFDGTLVDSNRIKRQTFYDVVAPFENGITIMSDVLNRPPGDRTAIFTSFVDQLNSRVGEPGNTSSERKKLTARLVEDYTLRCERAIAHCPEIPGADQLLADLHTRGTMIAINSATPESALTAIVQYRQWSRYLCCTLGGPARKAENLGRIGLEFGLERREMVMVGDQEADLRGAEEFGCQFVGLVRPDSEFGTPPTWRIHHLTELPEMLAVLESRG